MSRLSKGLLLALAQCARAGPWILVLGLLAGLTLPTLAATIRPLLPGMVIALLFLSALRIEPTHWRTAHRGLVRTVAYVLVLQLALPLLFVAGARLAGVAAADWVLALTVMLSASAISSAPNMSLMLGRPADPAMRILVVGTALLPLTVIPVFLTLPRLGGVTHVLPATLALLAAIVVSVGGGAAMRLSGVLNPSERGMAALDGVSALLLAVFVVGLMEAVSGLLWTDPIKAVPWLTLALTANLGLQAATWWVVRARCPEADAVALSLISGNRNMALFFVSLPSEVMASILIYLGFYQIPMFLTPLLMRRLYRKQTA